MVTDLEEKLPPDFGDYDQYICDIGEVDREGRAVMEGLDGCFITRETPRIGKYIPIVDRWYIIKSVRPYQLPMHMGEEYPGSVQHCEVDVMELRRNGKPLFLGKKLLKTAHEHILPGI